MMNRIALVIILSVYSFLANSQTIDVKHLKLELSFDWQKKQAIGTATITFSTQQESDKIALDAGFLEIEKVFFGNKNLVFQYNGGESPQNLIVSLGRKCLPSESITLKINYRTNHENRADPNAIAGSFGKGLRFFQPSSTTPNKRKQIWSSGEPENNKYWFPCNEDISDIHTTEIAATLEKPLRLISNGNLVNAIDHNHGTQTFIYKSERPFPNYLVSIVVGEYVDVQQNHANTTIHTFGYPHEKEAIAATVALLPDMMNFLEEKTGYRFPYSHYRQVVVQDYPFPGLVGQHNTVLISDNYIDDFGVHQDYKYLWDGVAMQALANQWFGNLLMPKEWNDIWLNNAFAQYFAGIYTEKDNGRAEYLLWYYPFEKWNIMNDWNTGNKHAIVPTKIEQLSAFVQDSYSKFKGAMVLRMLQQEMGDESWWRAIKYFVAQNAHKQVCTKDFQDAVEKISGKSYQWFFDQWLYKTGLPKFSVSKSYDADSKLLRVKVLQIQEKDSTVSQAQVDFFSGTIGIEIDGRIEKAWLKPQKENIFQFSAANNPKFVNFNVEDLFLCETQVETAKEEFLAQFKESQDVAAKLKALNKLVEVANDTLTSAVFRAAIEDAVFAEINSNAYWRCRMAALGALSRIVSVPKHEKAISLLKNLIANEKSWLKSTAISILGNTANPNYADLYIRALEDKNDRVINSAAIALGKTKSPGAFEVLMGLENQKSWKNQHRISALNGLQQLGDLKALPYVLNCIKDNQSPRWYLATPIWDYPFAAVNTLVSLGKGELAYPILLERFKQSLEEDDINDVFQNAQLIDLLRDERAKEIYTLLKEKFKHDAVMLEAIKGYEHNFLESIKP
jgi:aminopeptidase N